MRTIEGGNPVIAAEAKSLGQGQHHSQGVPNGVIVTVSSGPKPYRPTGMWP